MPVGVFLMLVTAANRLLLSTSVRNSITALTIVCAVAAVLYLFRDRLIAIDNLNLIVFFILVLGACVFSGVPIAFAFGLSTFSYLVVTTNTPLDIVIGRMSEGMSHLILLSVPLFVFLGLLIEATGMAKRLVLFLASLFGGLRGGLSYVLVGAMYLVSGISGSKTADMAAIAPALFPEMRKRGCKQGELVALLSATGAQTETIPPSLVLITIGSVTGVSISALFAGGLLPAAVVGALICGVIWFHSRSESKGAGDAFNMQEVAKSFLVAIPALALPFLIRAAVVEGVATATEVSTLGIVYTILIGALLYKEMKWHQMRTMLVDTALLSGAILLIIGCATGMAWGLTQSGFSNDLADFASRLPGGKWTFMAVSIVGFVLLGSVLEGIPAIVLFGPLMFPIAQNLGINDVHYAMVVVLAMGIGLFAPPFGVGYYAACAVSRVDPSEGFKPLIPYMIVLVIGVILVAAIPSISTCFL